MDDRAEKKSSSSKTMWIVVGVIIALIVLGASVYAVIMATTKKTPSTNQLNTTAKVTDEQLRLTFQEFNTKLDKDKADRATAQQALDDQVKRIKLAN